LEKDNRPALIPGRPRIISVVTGVSIAQMRRHAGEDVAVIRARPNTAIAIRGSMTCLAAANRHADAVRIAVSLNRSLEILKSRKESRADPVPHQEKTDRVSSRMLEEETGPGTLSLPPASK
jgi:hypothetical protein